MNRDRVESERELRAIEANLLGSGRGKQTDVQRAISKIERRAVGPGERGKRARTLGDWQAAGVKIVQTERTTDDD